MNKQQSERNRGHNDRRSQKSLDLASLAKTFAAESLYYLSIAEAFGDKKELVCPPGGQSFDVKALEYLVRDTKPEEAVKDAIKLGKDREFETTNTKARMTMHVIMNVSAVYAGDGSEAAAELSVRNRITQELEARGLGRFLGGETGEGKIAFDFHLATDDQDAARRLISDVFGEIAPDWEYSLTPCF